ncbi:Leucine-rich repeat [Sesbania bispinosa]|nr:Leucine-rich repeat [Sesbania bispinosa]
MSEQETHSCVFLLLFFSFILLSGRVVVGDSLDTDKQVLLKLKKYLDNRTLADQGGEIFNNFSQLTELTHLDLSQNTLFGGIPEDLRRCQKLLHLNLSHNILDGELNVTGMTSLQTLDLSMNRFHGELGLNFPATCDNLVTLNISGNNMTGTIGDSFDQCPKLQYLDLSTNNLSGGIWMGFARLREFSVAENHLIGTIPSEDFPWNCSLEELDLSQNGFVGEAPKEVANCKNLSILNLSSNNFTGAIPIEIGSISGLRGLYLGSNNFSRDIPESLLNLTNLVFLDLSRNRFGRDIQEIFGKFKQVRFLLLHSNSYTGGLISSGILTLPNIVRLDLSFNNFSGPLPVEISKMSSLKFLMLSYNQFNGSIPSEFGNMTHLQALDLAFNNLSGPIPPSLGNLSSLLWLMLADNSLTGRIPPELGNCSSLLWLNLANNNLSGNFPSELSTIGRNAMTTFESNRKDDGMVAGSGECLAMKRWIPADYPPFSFVYGHLNKENCRGLWDKLLKVIWYFPILHTRVLLSLTPHIWVYSVKWDQLGGEIPLEIGKMVNFSMFHLGSTISLGNSLQSWESIPLVVLNMTRNKFSGGNSTGNWQHEMYAESGFVLQQLLWDFSYKFEQLG